MLVLLDRKPAGKWRRVNALSRHCGQTFQPSGEDWERKSRARQEKVRTVFMCETFTKASCYGCMFFTTCVFVASAASVQDPPEPKNNLLLQEAVRALFASSPLFHTQTLTLDAFPVPDACHSPERTASAAALMHLDAAGDQETLPLLRPSMTNLRKRPREMQQLRERKRRKSSSWCKRRLCSLFLLVCSLVKI